MHVQESAKRAKDAALRLATLATATKNRALEAIADALIEHREHILEANRYDVTQATRLVERGALAKPLLDRLKLTEHKVLDMATGVRSVAGLPSSKSKDDKICRRFCGRHNRKLKSEQTVARTVPIRLKHTPGSTRFAVRSPGRDCGKAKSRRLRPA